jgi:hypothetical protein
VSEAITADEVASWFAVARPPRPDLEMCAELASKLDRMRRIKNGEPVEWLGGMPAIELRNDQAETPFWDTVKVSAACKNIVDAMPRLKAMASATDQEIYQAVLSLEQALFEVSEFIEWPLGRNESVIRHRPKDWHIAAISVAHNVAWTWLRAGKPRVSYARTSTAVRIVSTALQRIGYTESDVNPSAVSQYLSRWFAWAGEPTITTS